METCQIRGFRNEYRLPEITRLCLHSFPPPLRNLSYPKQYVCTVMAVMTRNVLRLMMQTVH